MTRLLQLLIMLAVVGLGLAFGAINKQPVPVDYFLFVLEWPLALSLAVFFFAGALLGGLLTYLGTWWAVRSRIRQVKAQARADSAPKTADAGPPALPKAGSGGNG